MNGFRIGRIFNINIDIDWSWLLILGLVTWSLAASFGQLHPFYKCHGHNLLQISKRSFVIFHTRPNHVHRAVSSKSMCDLARRM